MRVGKYNDNLAITREHGNSYFYADCLDSVPGHILIGLSHNGRDGAGGRVNLLLTVEEAQKAAQVIQKAVEQALEDMESHLEPLARARAQSTEAAP